MVVVVVVVVVVAVVDVAVVDDGDSTCSACCCVKKQSPRPCTAVEIRLLEHDENDSELAWSVSTGCMT